MNEHIEELILAYLHRGATPEQERELFDICKTNPDVSTYLRQHLILSLKLRQLRESEEVPAPLRNQLTSTINSHPSMEEKPSRTAGGVLSQVRFGWGYLSGATTVGIAAILVFLFLIPTEEPTGLVNAVSVIHDTVLVAQTDTIMQVKEIRRPVYITRVVRVPDTPSNTPFALSDSLKPQNALLTQLHDSSSIETDGPDERGNTQAKGNRRTHNVHADGTGVKEQPSYLEQYTAMVASLEKVRLTANDRIRN